MAVATGKTARVAANGDVIKSGQLSVARGKFTWSAAADTYSTGGIVIDWSLLPGFERFTTVKPIQVNVFSPTGVIGYLYDYTNNKLKVYTNQSRATEKTNAEAIQTTVNIVADDPYFVAMFKET